MHKWAINAVFTLRSLMSETETDLVIEFSMID